MEKCCYFHCTDAWKMSKLKEDEARNEKRKKEKKKKIIIGISKGRMHEMIVKNGEDQFHFRCEYLFTNCTLNIMGQTGHKNTSFSSNNKS